MNGEEMNILSRIKDKARSKKRRVVLPEGFDPRTIKAAKKIISEGIASVTILGDTDKVAELAKEHGLQLGKVEVIKPEHSPDYNSFVADFMELRAHKNISESEAKTTVAHPLYFGAMLVRHSKADASVAGAAHTTGDVIRSAIQVLGLKAGIKTVSSCFMMTIPQYRKELNKVFLC